MENKQKYGFESAYLVKQSHTNSLWHSSLKKEIPAIPALKVPNNTKTPPFNVSHIHHSPIKRTNSSSFTQGELIHKSQNEDDL